MSKKSAGILLYRRTNSIIEFFLVHPGGPFFINKDIGSWSIPKGEFTDDENAFEAAIREFKEETGIGLTGNPIELTPVKQKSGKMIYAWALEKVIPADLIVSNTFNLEWPPHSGKYTEFPEVDKAGWFDFERAKQKVNPAQATLMEELVKKLHLRAEQLASR